MKRVLLILAAVIVISGCAPDPRKEAQAYQIKEQADQDAANQELNRKHAEELQTINLQNLELEQAHREAVKAEWRAGLNKMIHYGFNVATIAVCILILAVAVAFSYGSIGTTKAIIRAAEVRANLIYLDPITREYPAFLQYIGHGKFSLTDLNKKVTLLLDTRNEPDRQMIATSGVVRLAGVIASEASKSNDPAGVSIIQPTVIDVQDESLTVGRDIIRRQG
jgi:hypothetical protein